jgi:predicted secreted protein
VYIDYIAYFNRIITVTNLIRAYNIIRIPCPETRLFRVLFK